MRRTLRWMLLSGLLALVLFAAVAGWRLLHDEPLFRQSALETTLKWARLAELPPSLRELQVKTEGGPFNRSFWISFVAPPSEIQDWLRRSPGTARRAPVEREVGETDPLDPVLLRHSNGLIPDGAACYRIEPGGGVGLAAVCADAAGRALIYAEWS